MPSRINLQYRTSKLKHKFIPTIRYDIFYEEEKVEEVEEDLIIIDTDEEEEVENVSQSRSDYLMFMEELKKIRKNSKRKLEMWIKQNRHIINIMDSDDKTELMLFIEQKYFYK